MSPSKLPPQMIFGPLPVRFAQKLEGLLKDHGSGCRIFVSEEDVQKYHKQVQSRPISYYPSFEGEPDLAYIEIKRDDLLIVRGEMEKMGIPIRQSEEPVAIAEEYLCPQCDEVSLKPGLCPKHNVPMLEFHEWAESRRRLTEKQLRRLRVIFFFLVLSLITYFGFRFRH